HYWRRDPDRFAHEQTFRRCRSFAGAKERARNLDRLFQRAGRGTPRARPFHYHRLSAASFARAVGAQIIMFDFLRRRRLLRRGLASKKTRRRRTRNELLGALESARYVKVFVLAAFIAGLAFLIFSGQQPEPTKNFVVALLFFAAAIVQLWINRPGTFSQNSRVFLVFGTIFVQLAATKVILVLSSEHAFKFLTPAMGWLLAPYAFA